MKRTTLSLIAGTAALAAVTGFAVVSTPEATSAGPAGAAASLPVERTGLTCPAPSTSDLAETTYTSFTPVTEGAETDGEAELTAAGEQDDEAVLKPEEPGTPATADVSGGDEPALIGTAE
ncbi:hypothetical protein NGM37_07795, partial [Streptomyces sp. TRM76130]|nr:hypothetical protein [Streptomyces sp. TRM76130]